MATFDAVHSATDHSGIPGVGSDVLNNFSASTAPAVGDDNGDGYSVGSIWVDTVADAAYICVDASTGAAIWNPFESAPAGASSYLGPMLGTLDYACDWASGSQYTPSRIYYFPFVVPQDVTVRRVWYATGTTVSGSGNVEIGVYDSSWSRLLTSGATAFATGSANAFVTIDVTDTPLTAGLYYMAFVASANTNMQLLRSQGWGQPVNAIGVLHESGSSLPSTATPAWVADSNVMLIGVVLEAGVS